jgi:N6-adenosine-specific RNA methylase IME4
MVMYSLDRIIVGEGRRAVVEATVLSLMQSIREIGLLHPITVQKIGDEIHLVAGRNRLEAFRRLGTHDKIPAALIEVSARIAELDENLCRGNLSTIEEARAVAERKQLYEERHPQTKHGGDRKGSSGHFGHLKGDSHSAAAAKATGQSERTIRRKAKIGAELDDHRFDAAIGTVLDKPEELAALVKLKQEAPEVVEALVTQAAAGEKVSASGRLKQITRAKNEAKLAAKITAFPDRLYGVIYADPPWRFEPWSRNTGMNRAAENHYPTLTFESIRDLGVPAAPDAVLFLWVTVPCERLGHDLLTAWGFEYRSQFIWRKDRMGTGFWNRNRHEILLLGVRGNVPAPSPGTQPDSVIDAPVGRHSEKPAVFAEMIETMFPTLPRLEMFARGDSRLGWDTWGADVDAPAEAAE